MPSDEPSDAQIEKCLHGVVKSLLRTGNGEQLTVKNARSRAEEALDLPVGFFKTHDQWKDRSKEVIEDFAVCGLANWLAERRVAMQIWRTTDALLDV